MQSIVKELKSGNAPEEEPSKASEPDVTEMDADELLGKMDMSEFFDPSELEELQKEIEKENEA